ncbi:16S rRNA (guanine(527)-N(7))-methyltransferase RsmG [Paragemmobacter ruber]|uniref:Ribosomal RNA small subunit methyltransferase G n=1 Tax=Paragemmobacter ruber TaxID=1985673 RepID=A0ABW9Y5Z7_9RHOB|nr:16S rRNA (guanine(527)-N(7))-methyltransferase RsmG [Rhodobacter ruber]NBE07312.1 16S rRNA (guanine(527)-N(7))-methyltransferase RsmG [Rhodobacter ruber]
MTVASLPEGVSRETLDRLQRLTELLAKWNPAINLVSRSTVDQAWDRHILDSAQIFGLAPPVATSWVDMGSGGGFPGLVIACLAAELRPQMTVTLIESDQRKATFLRQAAHDLGLTIQIYAQRIETCEPQNASVLSARALAALPLLLGFTRRHLSTDGIALFPKGASWRAEVEQARKDWQFTLTSHPSATDPQGAILAVKAVSHV